MKKAILFITTLIVSVVNSANAQNYTLAKDTASGTTNGYIEIKHNITNTSANALTFDWHVISTTLPNPSWTIQGFGLCDNQVCYAYNKNDATLNVQQTSLPLTAGGSFDLKLQIDVSPLAGGGPWYINLQLTDGITTTYPVFEINPHPTSLPTINRIKGDVVIYPNPARSELNVLFDGNAGIKNITVYNLIGKAVTVYKVAGNSASLDVTGIPSGIYFIRLVDAQGHVVATRKFTHQ